jgi:hypothetical protein
MYYSSAYGETSSGLWETTKRGTAMVTIRQKEKRQTKTYLGRRD